MRTIKFRAWDKREKRMIGRTEDDGEYTVCFNGEIRCINHGNAPFNVTLPQGLELMQFTGLLDRNGKEIYEGDILSGHSDGNGKVVWTDYDGGYDYEFSDGNNVGILEVLKDCLVIGNIYEDGHLLKG